MAEAIFNYEGSNTTIQCNINDKMKEIINKFITKIDKKQSDLYYLYNGNKIDDNLTFNEQANDIDKNRMKMNIIVNQNEEDNNEKIEKISTDIICPQYKENSLIVFKDFKINLSGCKNNHNNKDIILDIYENTQKINLRNIKCDICKNNNKGNTHNNEFYICITYNKNLCPLCKSIHDKNHSIINYDDKKYICKQHNESFIKYCKNCKEDICIVCEVNHEGHDIIDLRKMIIDKQELLKIKDDLKNSINKFKYKISLIKGLLDRIMNMLNKYYKINEDIINNYNMNNRYFYRLQNLYTLKINNQMIIKDLTYIINNDKISDVYEYSIDKFYNGKGEKYIGEMKNGLKEGEVVIYMKVIGKMV